MSKINKIDFTKGYLKLLPRFKAYSHMKFATIIEDNHIQLK